MSSHPYHHMDDPRLHHKPGGADLRYPWMGHIPPPPAEGRVTPPKPMKPWVGTEAHSHARSDDVIVIPRPFAFNPEARKEELVNPYKDQIDSKPLAHPEHMPPHAFDKGFVRELEKIDGVVVKGNNSGSTGGSGGGGGGGSSGSGHGHGHQNNSVVLSSSGSPANSANMKPRINCEFCDHTFSRREGLKRHEITAHTDIRNFKCHECPQTFARKDKLKRHVETVHMTEKRFECETCGKGFNRKDKLQKHLHSDKAHVMAPQRPGTLNKATQEPPLTTEAENNLRKDFEAQRRLEEERKRSEAQHLPHHPVEYSDSARAFLETLSQRLNTDLPVFP